MTTLAHGSVLRRAEKWRRCRPTSSDPLGVAHFPPRVAPASPGRNAPHRRGGDRSRQHHDRVQRGSRRRRRLRLRQPSAHVRQLGSAKAPGGSRLHQEVVRSDRCHRPPLGACPRQRRDGGLPVTSPWRSLRRRTPRAPSRQLPSRPRPGRRDRRGGEVSSARDRVEPGAGRATTDCSWASSKTRESSATSSLSSLRRPRAQTGSTCSSTRVRGRSRATPSTNLWAIAPAQPLRVP